MTFDALRMNFAFQLLTICILAILKKPLACDTHLYFKNSGQDYLVSQFEGSKYYLTYIDYIFVSSKSWQLVIIMQI